MKAAKSALAMLALGICLMAAVRLGLPGYALDGLAYLISLLCLMSAAGLAIAAAFRTRVGSALALSVGVAVAVPGGGALALASSSILRRALLDGPEAAGQSTFLSLASISATLTFALMLEMRFVDEMPIGLETDRRMTLRWLCIGGGALTTLCGAAGALLTDPSVAAHPDNSIAALMGAAGEGTFGLALLLVALSAMPREGFQAAVAEEEQELQKGNAPSRTRTEPAKDHVCPSLIAAGMGAAIILAAVLAAWWLALLALGGSVTWLLSVWRSNGRAVRADGGLPLHPVTFIATILAGVSVPFVAHGMLPSAGDISAHLTDVAYGLGLAALLPGYVAFATGHPPEPRTGLLPSVHTVGIWSGVAAWSALGLGCCAIAIAYGSSWFTFWTMVFSIPVMLLQSGSAISPALRSPADPATESAS